MLTKGDKCKASGFYQKGLQINPNYLRLLESYAQYLIDNQDLELAIDVIEKCLSLINKNDEKNTIYYKMLEAILRKNNAIASLKLRKFLGDYRYAIMLMENNKKAQAEKIFLDLFESKLHVESCIQIALLKQRTGKLKQSRQYFFKAEAFINEKQLDVNTIEPELLYKLGQFCRIKNKFKEAEKFILSSLANTSDKKIKEEAEYELDLINISKNNLLRM